jgi:hypothetical protein
VLLLNRHSSQEVSKGFNHLLHNRHRTLHRYCLSINNSKPSMVPVVRLLRAATSKASVAVPLNSSNSSFRPTKRYQVALGPSFID